MLGRGEHYGWGGVSFSGNLCVEGEEQCDALDVIKVGGGGGVRG